MRKCSLAFGLAVTTNEALEPHISNVVSSQPWIIKIATCIKYRLKKTITNTTTTRN